MTVTIDDKLRARVLEICEEQYLSEPDSESGWDDDQEPERYLMFERGHYGQTWLTWHSSRSMAAHYSLHQEYAEDWQAICLLDTETDAVLIPQDIIWG